MRYYLIAGEASGDLHASGLMAALQEEDPQAEFRFFGGDRMAAVGGTLVCHYSQLAYMGFVQVALHSRTILQGMSRCKADIVSWQPDVLILIDYPGFNLAIAKYIHSHTTIPVYYYISPKIWAWKERRIHAIRRDVTELFSILPFEVPFYAAHHYPIHYVGNPSVDSVARYLAAPQPFDRPSPQEALAPAKPVIALLAGSRKAEIADNLPRMLRAVESFDGYEVVVAGAPGIRPDFYAPYLRGTQAKVVFGQTYPLLQTARAALVTSGTATLETALFRVPQVVCYYIRCGKVVSALRRMFLKVKYISLVNLIVDRPIVTELVADGMTVPNIRRELEPLLTDTPARAAMLDDYDELIRILGPAGAATHAATQMVALLKQD